MSGEPPPGPFNDCPDQLAPITCEWFLLDYQSLSSARCRLGRIGERFNTCPIEYLQSLRAALELLLSQCLDAVQVPGYEGVLGQARGRQDTVQVPAGHAMQWKKMRVNARYAADESMHGIRRANNSGDDGSCNRRIKGGES